MEGRSALLSRDVITFLESGCGLIVGTVAPDGDPHATRGWGLTVLPGDDLRVRLLIPAEDQTAIEHLAPGGRVAITGGDVTTLRSIQLKGRSLGIEPATETDQARARLYTDAFFTDVETTDQIDRSVLARLEPAGYVACIVEVDDLYDQTPGPEAGVSMRANRP